MGKHMGLEQRLIIKKMLDSGNSVSVIADTLKVHIGTIYKEIERCGLKEDYDPYNAQSLYEGMAKNKGRMGILSDINLAKYISDLILIEHLSPEKIVTLFAEDSKGFSDVPHSANTIYSAIDKGLIPNVTRETFLKKVSTVFSGGQICIPKWVLDKLDIKDGDELVLEITNDNKIVYTKADE